MTADDPSIGLPEGIDAPLPPLHESMDAMRWATEFMTKFGNRRDEIDTDLMLAWFANAIMAGYDTAARRAERVPAPEASLSVDSLEWLDAVDRLFKRWIEAAPPIYGQWGYNALIGKDAARSHRAIDDPDQTTRMRAALHQWFVALCRAGVIKVFASLPSEPVCETLEFQQDDFSPKPPLVTSPKPVSERTPPKLKHRCWIHDSPKKVGAADCDLCHWLCPECNQPMQGERLGPKPGEGSRLFRGVWRCENCETVIDFSKMRASPRAEPAPPSAEKAQFADRLAELEKLVRLHALEEASADGSYDDEVRAYNNVKNHSSALIRDVESLQALAAEARACADALGRDDPAGISLHVDSLQAECRRLRFDRMALIERTVWYHESDGVWYGTGYGGHATADAALNAAWSQREDRRDG